MSWWRKALLIDEPLSADDEAALKRAREEMRLTIKEMDAGIQPRNDNTLFEAYMRDAITSKEYDLYKLTWRDV